MNVNIDLKFITINKIVYMYICKLAIVKIQLLILMFYYHF